MAGPGTREKTRRRGSGFADVVVEAGAGQCPKPGGARTASGSRPSCPSASAASWPQDGDPGEGLHAQQDWLGTTGHHALVVAARDLKVTDLKGRVTGCEVLLGHSLHLVEYNPSVVESL